MKVKVWNDNIHPYKEKFKGEDILISSKAFILMDRDDAYQFKGTFNWPVLDSDGNHTPLGYKMIRIEESTQTPEPTTALLRCMACAYRPSNAADLAEHTKTHEHLLFTDPLAEEALKETRAASPVPDIVKRKPGRPPKTPSAA